MEKNWRKILRPLRIGAGLFFVILGILGLFLPILQGILFLVIGGTLLGRDTAPGRWLNDRIRQVINLAKKNRSQKSVE